MTSVNKTAKDFYMNPSEFNVEQFRDRMELVKYFVDAARNSKGKMNKTYLNVLFLAFARYSNEELEYVINTNGLSQSINSVIKKVMNDVREDNSFKDAVNSRLKMEEFASRLQDRMDDIIRPEVMV